MIFKFFTAYKGISELSYDFLFIFRKLIRTSGIDGREIAVGKRIFSSVKLYRFVCKVNFMK